MRRRDGMSPQTKSRGPLIPKAVPPPLCRAPSQKESPFGHFWVILHRLSQLLPPPRASPSVSLTLGHPRPGALSHLPTPLSKKPVLTCWLTLVETPLLHPRRHQLLLHSLPLGVRHLPTGALPTLMPSAVAPALLCSEASLQLVKPRSSPSQLLRGAARGLHLVPLRWHPPVSQTASQMWAASWDPGCPLQVFLAAFSGWPARSPHSSLSRWAAAAAQGWPLEPSPTLLQLLPPSPRCLPPTHSSPMAWRQGQALG